MNALSRARVLVLTDDESRHRVRPLDGAEFDVVRARAGAHPLRSLDQGPFDVVVTDVSAPATKGLALLDSIRHRGVQLPVIIVSSRRNEKLSAEVRSRGAEICEPTALVATVRRTLRAQLRERRVLSFRNRRGEQIDVESVSATAAKNEFGKVLDTALQQGAVAITRHDAPKAVLLDIEEYNALVATKNGQLDRLAAQFDELVGRMQTPQAQKAVRAAFAASPAELGKAAVIAATKDRG
jgi:prevent-host-death family protein